MTILKRLTKVLKQRHIKNTDEIWLQRKSNHIGVYGYSSKEGKEKWVTWVSKQDARRLEQSGLSYSKPSFLIKKI